MEKDCKKCIHYDLCKDLAETLEMEGCICNHHFHFKDKSQIVELPCEEGENLYYISKHNTTGCFLNVSYETILMCVNDYHNGEIKFMATTREKAETRLKELKENGSN